MTLAIPPHDAALRHGIGLFESMRIAGGRAMHRQRHLDRLMASVAALAFPAVVERAMLEGAIDRAEADFAAGQGTREGRLRLTLSAGDADLLAPPATGQALPPARCWVVAHALAAPRYGSLLGGIDAVAAGRFAPLDDPHAGHKTLAYWWRLDEYQRARSLGAQEALLVTRHGMLTGATLSNVFLRRGAVLLTPLALGELPAEPPSPEGRLDAPTLPGVTRALLLQVAPQLGLRVRMQALHVSALAQADEVFLTNSGFGLAPLRTYAGQGLGRGEPLAPQLFAALQGAT